MSAPDHKEKKPPIHFTDIGEDLQSPFFQEQNCIL